MSRYYVSAAITAVFAAVIILFFNVWRISEFGKEPRKPDEVTAVIADGGKSILVVEWYKVNEAEPGEGIEECTSLIMGFESAGLVPAGKKPPTGSVILVKSWADPYETTAYWDNPDVKNEICQKSGINKVGLGVKFKAQREEDANVHTRE